MRKKLIEYIRENDQCNYTDLHDYLRELGHCDAELRAQYLMELLMFINSKEQEEQGNSTN